MNSNPTLAYQSQLKLCTGTLDIKFSGGEAYRYRKGAHSTVSGQKRNGKRRPVEPNQRKVDLISDFLILAEAVQKVRGNVAYECPSQGASWNYLDDGLKSLGMREIEISSGRLGGKSAFLNRKGVLAWATRKIVTDCDEIVEALRDLEYHRSGGGVMCGEVTQSPCVLARNDTSSASSF